LVEDHADTAVTTALLLQMFGHEVQVNMDGPAALNAVNAQEPDVVLLDLGLPKMDGYEVARRLRALQTQKQPILIALSGYGGPEEERRCEDAGIDLHLLKPVDPEQLKRILARIASARAEC